MIEKIKKPVSVYVFGTLFLIVYLIYMLNTKLFYSSEFIIANIFNTYIVGILGFLGFTASILILVSRKYKMNVIVFYGVIIITIICIALNITGIITNVEIGVNIIVNIMLLVGFSFNDKFKNYFKLNQKNK